MMPGQGEGARRVEMTEDTVRTLINDAEKMGLTPDVRNLLEDFDEYKKRLEVKVQELSIIEAIAMESMDENVKDLREQLFTVVKLIHSDKIAEVVNEFKNRDRSGGFTSDSSMKEQASNNTISKYDIMERMRRYLNKRSDYKRMKESTRKPQPVSGGSFSNL